MTDDERMDRAKRIREMREGSRDGDDEASSSDATDENRTDGGDPEKQTMDDVVDAADEANEAESSDDGEDSATGSTVTEADTTAESAGDVDTTAEPAGNSDTVAETAGDTPADDDTVGTTAGEESATQTTDAGTGARESLPSMGESEPTTAETGSTAATDENGSADDGTASVDETAADEGGVSAPLPEMDELEQALEGSATADPETVATGMAESGGGSAMAAQMGTEAGPVDAGTETADTPGAPAAGEEETADQEETRVLEFTLDDEHYCLDIQYIEEIVKHENITRVPNTPAHVEGVVDLRGQITTILNPKVTIGKENDEAGELIVVFDAEAFEDQGYIGWVVDDVRQVSPIVESEVNDPPMAEDYINGVIDRDDDDEFVIWTSPELAFDDED